MVDDPNLPPVDKPEPCEPAPEESRSRIRRWWVPLSQGNKIAIATAVLAGCVALIAAILPQIVTTASREDALELVDATVLDFEPGEDAAVVDIKLRSGADQVAFAKRVDIVISDARQIEFCPMPLAQEITYSYDVALPALPGKLPFTVSKPISQALGPNDSDRFVLKLGTEGLGGYTIGGTVYLFKLRLYYNEGEGTYLDSGPLLAYVSYPSEPRGYSVIDSPEWRNCVKQNAANLEDLVEQDAYRSEGLSKLAEDYKEAVAEF